MRLRVWVGELGGECVCVCYGDGFRNVYNVTCVLLLAWPPRHVRCFDLPLHRFHSPPPSSPPCHFTPHAEVTYTPQQSVSILSVTSHALRESRRARVPPGVEDLIYPYCAS